MKKFMLVGNCQTGPISSLMSLSKTFSETYDIVPFSLIHTVDKTTLSDISLIKKVDLIISQQLYNEQFGIFNTKVLSEICKKENVQLIILSNPFFKGYYPFAIHLHNIDPQKQKVPISQDGIIFYSYHKKLTVEQACTLWTKISSSTVTRDFATKTCASSLKEFVQRERHEPSTEVVLRYFLKNYRSKKLMHSLNHPTNILYKEIVQTYMRSLGINEEIPIPKNELQGNVSYPIMDAVRHALRLTHACDDAFTVFGIKKDLLSYAEYLYDFYKNNTEIFKLNVHRCTTTIDTISEIESSL
ncbi:hypothetical protein G3N56_02920 [Desulfovibrio sulfodismutans]|uniref:Polysaccharide biosynthesis enzyme WcbI domain-containing protein n=1 Tax=Desulfolutivibrio sulfodismutans TaxID=63561 RepID=A0A7K3NHL5_9BACT|nr:WcbI family polysaccharide biosynthesis putative acetyltransferase [Desulfolutivibrio sulfodismutans]NDY55694.1 hypothetical protein [Desulfolutivibrio sulfodismutans]QLA13715.1 hypothetical protein GD606_16350 [Desulfolutivibrio sulfodismutans DSM 3696]